MPRITFDEVSGLLGEIRQRRGGVTIPRIWIAAALSVLLHALALWSWKADLHRSSSDRPDRHDKSGPLIVELKRSTSPRPAPAPPAPRPTPEPRAQKPAPAPSPPPVLALKKPAPRRPPPLATPSPPQVAPPPGDLSSYVEARRSARGESPPAAPAPEVAPSAVAESDNARANRIAAANLGTDRTPTFGSQPRKGGGVFDIRRMGYDYAEFVFYGWNKDIRRNTQQLIEVRQGTNPNIRIAVVRRMIAIIRDHEQGDFTWESHRLGRSLTLSARPRDTAGLEDFLMREFF